MGIIRTVHNNENPYAMINKRAIDNPNLTFKATGLYSYLMGKPDNWKISIEHLSGVKPDGAKAVRSALRELEAEGYITRNPVRNAKGIITEWEQVIFEFPIEVSDEVKENKITPALAERKLRVRDKLSKSIPKNPEYQDISPDAQNGQVAKNDTIQPYVQNVHVVNGQVENRHVENDTLIINDLSNKELINNDSNDTKNGCVAAAAPEPEKEFDNSDIPPEAIGLAVRLAIGIKQNHPKTPKTQCPDPELRDDNVLLWKWANQLRLLNEIGMIGAKKSEHIGWPWDDIEAIIDFALTDERFWSKTARSAYSIREQADKINDAMHAVSKRQSKRQRADTRSAPSLLPKPSKPNLSEPFDDEGIYLIKPGESRTQAYIRVEDLVAYGKASAEKMAIFRERTAYKNNVG